MRILPATSLRERRERDGFVPGGHELPLAQKHIPRIQTARDAIEPAALGEITDGNFGRAERLHGLRRKLHVSEQIDLRHFPEADFLLETVAIPDLDDLARFPNPKALRVQI